MYDYTKVELSVAELKVKEILVKMLIFKYTRIPSCDGSRNFKTGGR